MTKHTPWELVTEDDPRGQPVPYYRGLVCIVSATPRLSVVTANGSTVDSEHWPRIGRLIAAAPDLLDAIENLLTAIDQFDLVGELDAGCDGEGPYEIALAAIAKATA